MEENFVTSTTCDVEFPGKYIVVGSCQNTLNMKVPLVKKRWSFCHLWIKVASRTHGTKTHPYRNIISKQPIHLAKSKNHVYFTNLDFPQKIQGPDFLFSASFLGGPGTRVNFAIIWPDSWMTQGAFHLEIPPFEGFICGINLCGIRSLGWANRSQLWRNSKRSYFFRPRKKRRVFFSAPRENHGFIGHS